MTKTPVASWVALLFLTAVITVNYVDRFLLSILIDPIKHDLKISDTQVGLMTGAAFALFYSILAIPVARLAERTNRLYVLAGSLVLWSAATMLSGVAGAFATLLVARVLVGCGEAGALPPSHSMTADFFRSDQRATAMAIIGLGAAAGTTIAPLVGGVLSDAVGWRGSFGVVGAIGLVLAVLLLIFVREPRRGVADGIEVEAPPPFAVAAKRLMARKAFVILIVGMTLMSLCEYSFFLWLPPLLHRTFGTSGAELGGQIALYQGVPFFVATLLGGVLADRLARRDRRWNAWIPLVSAVVTGPAIVLLCLVPNRSLALLLLIAPSFANGFYIGPSYAMIQSLAAVQSRATATAILVFAVNLIGAGLGPLLLGMLSDSLTGTFGADSLRYALLSLPPIYLVAIWVFIRLGQTLEQGLHDAEAESRGGSVAGR